MTDLSFVPFEEIQAELMRRFPAFVLVFRYQPEGHKGQAERICFHAASGGYTEALGLTVWAQGVIHQRIAAQIQVIPNNTPLDPGTKPPAV